MEHDSFPLMCSNLSNSSVCVRATKDAVRNAPNPHGNAEWRQGVWWERKGEGKWTLGEKPETAIIRHSRTGTALAVESQVCFRLFFFRELLYMHQQ